MYLEVDAQAGEKAHQDQQGSKGQGGEEVGYGRGGPGRGLSELVQDLGLHVRMVGGCTGHRICERRVARWVLEQLVLGDGRWPAVTVRDV